MDLRHGGRAPQVRHRPSPSSGKRRVKARPVEPSPTRLTRYRRIERRRGLPFAAKALLATSIVVMGGFIMWAGSGSVGPFLASIVRGFGGFVETVGSTVASQAPTEAPVVSDAPVLAVPEELYTSAKTVDVTVTIPNSIVGESGYTVVLWVTPPDAAPVIIARAPVGATSAQVLQDVALAKGRNDMQASIRGPGGESKLSAVASWILDNVKPAVTILSPRNGQSISRSPTTIKGKTQARSMVRLTNDVNGATSTVEAGSDGLWETGIAIGEGHNTITITITDLAGNVNTGTLELRRGSGKLRANLTGSTYRFKASSLPKRVTFTVVVTNPDGSRLEGATALFTVSVPGLEAIVSGEIWTDAAGLASFTTNIPNGALPGAGLATVLITTNDLGSVTDRQVLSVE